MYHSVRDVDCRRDYASLGIGNIVDIYRELCTFSEFFYEHKTAIKIVCFKKICMPLAIFGMTVLYFFLISSKRHAF